MERREIIKYTALLTGGAIGAPLLATLMSGCKADVPTAGSNNVLHFFDQKNFELVQKMVNVILPKTDSPSATDVGVHVMIDAMVGTVYKKEDREKYNTGFEALITHLRARKGDQKLANMNYEQQASLLNELETSADEKLELAREAYKDIKQQTIAYYLSTEEISKNYLNYLPIPGEYEGCISLDSVGGKKWAI